MKKQNIEELFMDYFDGNISSGELKKIISESEQYKNSFDEIDKLKMLYSKLDEIDIPEPGKNLDKIFYNMLENVSAAMPHPRKRTNVLAQLAGRLINWVTLPKISFAALLLVLGIAIGRWVIPDSGNKQYEQLSAELSSVKEVMMLTMLQQPSPAERIKAVNYVNSLSDVDNKVANALIETLNSDPNVNVRLATIDALSAFTQNPQVRQGLVRSIANQTSPLVQVALADLMAAMKEKNSIAPLKSLLADKKIKNSVKVKIENCIANI